MQEDNIHNKLGK